MNFLKLTLSLLAIIPSFSAFADIVCKGRVVSADDLKPLIGVTILIENSNTGTASDLDGNFTIKAPEGSNLRLMYIGCETQTVKAKANLGTITMQYSDAVIGKGEPEPTPEEVEEWVDEGLKLFDEKKYDEAFRKFQNASIEGNPRGEYLVAICYRDGVGTGKDTKRYVGNMFSSAEQGYAPAQYLLALMYRDGDGVPKSLKAAEEYLKKAAAQGFDKAKIALYDMNSNK
ncbi:MAG: carboxypeptidase-like regulatory domain-containing protein [Muribaculaceae bacterium]|nr:carboxypeptidase-like regulatory domain-containing protein [Muribaculaceae bacterium]